jgi:hypothetical protein
MNLVERDLDFYNLECWPVHTLLIVRLYAKHIITGKEKLVTHGFSAYSVQQPWEIDSGKIWYRLLQIVTLLSA